MFYVCSIYKLLYSLVKGVAFFFENLSFKLNFSKNFSKILKFKKLQNFFKVWDTLENYSYGQLWRLAMNIALRRASTQDVIIMFYLFQRFQPPAFWMRRRRCRSWMHMKIYDDAF